MFTTADSSVSLSSSSSPEAAASHPERRRPQAGQDAAALKAGLMPAQLVTLQTMEQFHWKLRYVRRPLFRAPIPLVFDPQGTRFVVIEEDGSINEHPQLKVRD